MERTITEWLFRELPTTDCDTGVSSFYKNGSDVCVVYIKFKDADDSSFGDKHYYAVSCRGEEYTWVEKGVHIKHSYSQFKNWLAEVARRTYFELLNNK